MAKANAQMSYSATSSDMRRLYVDLKGVEGNLRVSLRRRLTAAAQPVTQAVAAGGAFSSRIPRAVKAKPSFSAKKAGILITVDAKKAPNAAPLENQGKSGTFRHPVFGTDTWVEQPAHPFFYKAANGKTAAVTNEIQKVLDDVASAAGFK